MTIDVERRDTTAWVTLNRPEARNALSRETCEELCRVAEELANESGVRSVVLTGTGSVFCAGADLKERAGLSAAETRPYVDAIGQAIRCWSELPKVTVAAINGGAFGGGLELALGCDFRITVEDAKFALPEVRLGIMPGAGGTQRLPRLIGVPAAKELILLGRRIDASRARELGLVTEVVPNEQLASAAEKLVAEVAHCAPLSIVQAKAAIERGVQVPLEEGLAIEVECYDKTLFSEDRNEGLRAFAEKRPPRFEGR